LDDNNLRGLNGEKILRQIVECSGLRYLSVSKNFLGQATAGQQAPITVLSALLLKTNTVEDLDLSYN
jgi:hypothetical protein